MASRYSRVQAKKSRRQAVVYLLLSIVFVIAAIKWGVPGFIQLLAWWSGADKTKVVTSGFKLPPQTPALAPLPEATFSAMIKVSGVAQSGVRVILLSNNQHKDETTTDLNGSFSFDSVALLSGKNVIGVQSINGNDMKSNIAQAEITLDTEPPNLEIREPATESDFFGPTQKQVIIRGTMNESGGITISGNFVVVDSTGGFSYQYPFNEGMNEIIVEATDGAGNTSSQLLRLRYTP